MDNIKQVGRSGRVQVAPPSLRVLGTPPVANLGFRFRRTLNLPLVAQDEVKTETLLVLIQQMKEGVK